MSDAHPMYDEAPIEQADILQANFSFDWLEILPAGWPRHLDDESAPNSLRRFPYLFGLNDAAGLLALPCS